MTTNNSSKYENTLENITSTILYRPSTDNYKPSLFGFFIIEDNWSEESLIALKREANLDYLIALQTTDKCIDRFKVIDGIISCKCEEVQRVITIIDYSINQSGLIGISLDDIAEACGSKSTARFIRASTMSTPDINKVFETISQLLSQIPKEHYSDLMIIDIEFYRYFTLEEWNNITDLFDDRWDAYINPIFSTRLIENPNHSWIGMIYNPTDQKANIEIE